MKSEHLGSYLRLNKLSDCTHAPEGIYSGHLGIFMSKSIFTILNRLLEIQLTWHVVIEAISVDLIRNVLLHYFTVKFSHPM